MIKQQGFQITLLLKNANSTSSTTETFKESMAPAQRYSQAGASGQIPNPLLPSYKADTYKAKSMPIVTNNRGNIKVCGLPHRGARKQISNDTTLETVKNAVPGNVSTEDALVAGASAYSNVNYDDSTQTPEASGPPMDQRGDISLTGVDSMNFSTNGRANPALASQPIASPHNGGDNGISSEAAKAQAGVSAEGYRRRGARN